MNLNLPVMELCVASASEYGGASPEGVGGGDGNCHLSLGQPCPLGHLCVTLSLNSTKRGSFQHPPGHSAGPESRCAQPSGLWGRAALGEGLAHLCSSVRQSWVPGADDNNLFPIFTGTLTAAAPPVWGPGAGLLGQLRPGDCFVLASDYLMPWSTSSRLATDSSPSSCVASSSGVSLRVPPLSV